MQICRFSWELLKSHGSFWILMRLQESHGSFWSHMGISEFSWELQFRRMICKFLRSNENSYSSIKISKMYLVRCFKLPCKSLQIPMETLELSWEPPESHRNSWILMRTSDSMQIPRNYVKMFVELFITFVAMVSQKFYFKLLMMWCNFITTMDSCYSSTMKPVLPFLHG